MPDEMISRERASTVRLVSQSAVAVFVAGAGLLLAFGLPFSGGAPVREVAYEDVRARAAELTEASATPESAGEDEGVLPPDVAAIVYSLNQIRNAPVVEQPPEPDQTVAEDTEPDPADAGGRTRFLGTVRVGDRYLALLSAGGAQRIMGVGEKRTLPLMPGDQQDPPTVIVHDVNEERVSLTENGTHRVIERAPRVGISVSQGAAPSPVSPPGPGNATPSQIQAGMAISDAEADRPINPDDYRREDGTIDYEALRAAARERAKARRERFRSENEAAAGLDGSEN